MKYLNKLLTIFLLLGILFVSIFTVYCIYKEEQEKILKSIQIEFDNNSKFEFGSEILSEEIINFVVGNVVDYPEIDTLTVGKQILTFEVEHKGQSKTIQHEIEIIDTKFPEITLKEDAIRLKHGEEYNPNDNIDSVFDVVDGEITDYEINHSLDVNKAGEYNVEIKAEDSNGNLSNSEFTIIVEEKEVAVEEVKPTYINSILLVNKSYHLPSSFGGPDSTANKALEELQQAAKLEGYDLPLLSGYRSYEYQKQLFQNYASKYGVEKANTFSARAGQSEHQTGLAFDVGSIDDEYGETESGKWLAENCKNHGFIIRYPEEKQHITGYKYEPWHIRYVGKEKAIEITNSGLTLEEYLGVY